MVNVPAAAVVVVAVVLVVGCSWSSCGLAAARDLAARRGHDPGEAGRVTLLGGGARLAATYLKTYDDGPGGEPSAPGPRAERLEELESLRQRHLITDEEAAARRAETIAELQRLSALGFGRCAPCWRAPTVEESSVDPRRR